MEVRTYWTKRISDGLLPPPIAQALYTTLATVGPTEINGWSLVHMLSGALSRNLTPTKALQIHSMWELFQFLPGDNRWDFETVIDIVLDTCFFYAGYQLAQ